MIKKWQLNIPYWVREHIEKNEIIVNSKDELINIGKIVLNEIETIASKYGKDTMGYSSWMGDGAKIKEWLKKLDTL